MLSLFGAIKEISIGSGFADETRCYQKKKNPCKRDYYLNYYEVMIEN